MWLEGDGEERVNSCFGRAPNTVVWLQVDYVEPSQNQISLKMIPRIDFDRIKARMSLVCRPNPQAPRFPITSHPRGSARPAVEGLMAAWPKSGFLVVP